MFFSSSFGWECWKPFAPARFSPQKKIQLSVMLFARYKAVPLTVGFLNAFNAGSFALFKISEQINEL